MSDLLMFQLTDCIQCLAGMSIRRELRKDEVLLSINMNNLFSSWCEFLNGKMREQMRAEEDASITPVLPPEPPKPEAEHE